MKIKFYLKLYKYQLNISNKKVDSIGKFGIFCLKAIKHGANIEDISDIIQIKAEFIKKQLNFVIEREYISNKYKPLKKGEDVLKIYNFINLYEKNIITIAIETYIEEIAEKKIFNFDLLKNKTSSSFNILLNPRLGNFRVKNSFYEMQEKNWYEINERIVREFTNKNNAEKLKTLINKKIPRHILERQLKEWNFTPWESDMLYTNSLRNGRVQVLDILKDKFPEEKNLIESENENFIFNITEINNEAKSNEFYVNMEIPGTINDLIGRVYR